MKTNASEITHVMLRILLGALMISSGIMKAMDLTKPLGLLTKIGFPFPSFFVWVLFLSEIIFGLCLVFGFKVKYTVWPLILILVIAVVTVIIPGGSIGSTIFHLIAIMGMLHMFTSGPGRLALTKN